MIDICTVVFEPEIDILKTQARSIELYCQDIGLHNIWVMVNDSSAIDPAWWGSLADRVQVIHRSKLGNQWSDYGWVSQQVLKMLGAAQSNNQWCMIVDAKTLFVRPVNVNDLFIDGRAATGWMPIYPVFEASKSITDQLFGIDLPAQLGPGGVPFFVEPAVVRSMLAHIESHTGQSFAEYFQQQGRLTEFILYSGYIWYLDGNFESHYHAQNRVFPCNVCHSEVQSFDRKFANMQQAHTLTVSVHRNAWLQLDQRQQQQFQSLLAQRGLT